MVQSYLYRISNFDTSIYTQFGVILLGNRSDFLTSIRLGFFSPKIVYGKKINKYCNLDFSHYLPPIIFFTNKSIVNAINTSLNKLKILELEIESVLIYLDRKIEASKLKNIASSKVFIT